MVYNESRIFNKMYHYTYVAIYIQNKEMSNPKQHKTNYMYSYKSKYNNTTSYRTKES